jgi:predicted  nucleic acid-binding Zn-ribbon protein
MGTTRLILLVGLAGLVAGTLLFSQQEESELDRVSEQVQALQKEVSSLVVQVELLEKDIAQLKTGRASKPFKLPPGTLEREINGLRYYLLPVAEDPEKKSP